jgi:hypothetical protein
MSNGIFALAETAECQIQLACENLVAQPVGKEEAKLEACPSKA